MHLTGQTDVAIRILMYLAAHPTQQFILEDIARVFNSPRPQVAKAAQALRRSGYIASRKGRNGGISLARPAQQIPVSDVVRAVEPNFELAECFAARSCNRCPLADGCPLKTALAAALDAFLARLAEVTLADLIVHSDGSALAMPVIAV